MSGQFGKCKVIGHENEMLISVCLQEDCNLKGLVCSKCISNQEKHFNHSIISPELFIQQYKEIERTNTNPSEKNLQQLKSLQQDLIQLNESFLKSIQDEITQFSQRLHRQFVSEQSIFQSSKDNDAEAMQALKDIEQSTSTTNPNDAALKFDLLIKRVRINSNKQLESQLPYSEKVNSVVRTAITINQNVSSENAKIIKDIQLYFEGILRFFSQLPQQQPSQIPSRNYNSGSTFGQFSRPNPRQFSSQMKNPEEVNSQIGHNQILQSQPHQQHINRSVSPLPEDYSISPVPVGTQMKGIQSYQTSTIREPQNTELQSRSNSLTKNIGQASTQAISAHHQSYFNDMPYQQQQQFYNIQQSRIVNANGTSVGLGSQFMHKTAFQQRQASGNFAKLNNNRVWWKAHEGCVRSMVFLDNDKVASAGDDGIVRLWERLEGKLLATLQGHLKQVDCLAYQDTGRILASGSSDRTIRVWRPVPAWQCVQSLKGHYSNVGAIVFINDRSMASGGIDGIVQIWDLDKGVAVQSLNMQQTSPISSLLLLQNQLLVGSKGKFQIWNLNSNQLVRESRDEHNSGEITRILSIKRKGKMLLVSAGVDQSVKFWDFHMLNVLYFFQEDFPVADIVYLQRKDCMAVSLCPWTTYEEKTPTITIWDINTLTRTHAFIENHSPSTCLLFDEQYHLLYSSHSNNLVEYNRII